VKRRTRHRQRCGQEGAALIALLAVIMLAASWMLLSRLNASSIDIAAERQARNGRVLAQAKQALLGWIALQATKAGEDDPGRLPCPESAAIAGSATEGGTAGTCSATPAIGRFPWRTFGMDKPVDAAGEPLWYVVSAGWVKASSANLNINSNSVGALTVDGRPNAAVALIIAPGPPMNIQASAGCNARNQQSRGAPSAGINVLDYVECLNTATSTFSTTGPSASFNDQVVAVTVADIMPVLEAAIASRIEREIVPALRSVYAPPDWGLSGNPVYPFAAPFGNPGPGAGASNFQGAAGTFSGLLPFSYSESCNPATDARCSTSFVAWDSSSISFAKTGGSGNLAPGACTNSPANTLQCTATMTSTGDIQVRMSVRAANVAMSLRRLDTSIATVEYFSSPSWVAGTTTSVSGTLASDGSGTFTVNASLPSIGAGTNLRLTMTTRDHALLDPDDGATGWFVRNEWYRLAYYALASGHTASVLPAARSCTTGGTCLSVVNGDPARPIAPAGGQRALLILAGRSINASARPSAVLSDYLEFGNATAAYERQPVSTGIDAALRRPFNDRVVVVGTN
jgi:hypothetical protein